MGRTGWYGGYELRVYAGSAADDPIIRAASEIQNRLAQWVDGFGAGAFAAILALLVAIVVAARIVSARRTPHASRHEDSHIGRS